MTLRLSRDHAANRALFARAFRGSAPWVGDHHAFWVLTVNGLTAGFCSAVVIPDDATVFLSSAYVFPEYRGQRWQRVMIRRRLAWAKRRGATTAVTYTVEENWQSVASLLAVGFRSYDPQYRWCGKAWYFRRTL